MTEIDYGRLDAIEAALGGRAAIVAAFQAGKTLGGASLEAWNNVGDAGKPAFSSGFSAYLSSRFGKIRYAKDSLGVVRFQGHLDNNGGSGAAFQLPVGYRPGSEVVIPTLDGGYVRIDTNGLVYPSLGPARAIGGYAPSPTIKDPFVANGILYSAFGSYFAQMLADGSQMNQQFLSVAATTGRLIVEGSFLYWTDQGFGKIGRANLDGTGANYSFITTSSTPYGLCSDGTYLYWVHNVGTSMTIGRAKLDGTSVNNSFITLTKANPVHIDTDRTGNLFWAYNAQTVIGRAGLDGSGLNESFISSGGSNATGVCCDGTYVYFGGQQAIYRTKIDGTSGSSGTNGRWAPVNPGTELSGGPAVAGGQATDGLFVYQANGAGGLLRVPTAVRLDGATFRAEQ